jgi:hypothetical protein
MDPNAGWFAVAGALAAGVPQLVGTVVEAKSKRGQRAHDAKEAEAARDAEANQAEAQRQHEQRQAEAETRRLKVSEWRDGLAAAHKEFKEWEMVSDSSRRTGVSMELAPEPNLVGQAWFQSLRENLSQDGEPNRFTKPNYYRTGSERIADDNAADVLGREISRIEREWNV